MHLLIRFIYCCFFILIAFESFAQKHSNKYKEYYISSSQGNDNNDGSSPQNAWKSLSKLNATTFSFGDKILLRAGDTWTKESIKLKGSGKHDMPIVIDKYGEGNKPRIDCMGNSKYAVYLVNNAYVEIKNLEITNWTPLAVPGNTGIVIEAKDIGILNHIHLINLDIHDVTGDGIKKDQDNGGIYFRVSGDKRKTRFNDILVQGCSIVNVNRSGLFVGYTSWNALYEGYDGDYPIETISACSHTQVIIRNNYIESSGGDAIVVCYSDKPLIEHNISYDCCKTSHLNNQASAAMWPWRCEDALFQYNEVYNTNYCHDGHAWDLDYSNRTIYQYNYSENNKGGCVMFCREESKSGIFRYNISKNDAYFIDNVNAHSGYIHNNIFYSDNNSRTDVVRRKIGGELRVENNIFYYRGRKRIHHWDDQNITYNNNLYYGFSSIPNDSNAITSDPKFKNPKQEVRGINSLQGFKLDPNSPCINSGVIIKNDTETDFWGQRKSKINQPSIGVQKF